MKPLYPLIWLFIISTCWALFSNNDILDKDPRVFFMITGTIFSNFSVKITSHEILFNSVFLTNSNNSRSAAWLSLKWRTHCSMYGICSWSLTQRLSYFAYSHITSSTLDTYCLYLLKCGFSTRSSSFIVFYIFIMAMLSCLRCANISVSNASRYERKGVKWKLQNSHFFLLLYKQLDAINFHSLTPPLCR